MKLSDFLLLAAICFVWGLNVVVSRWVVYDMGVPPLFFAGMRFIGIVLVLFPFLRPIPPQLKMLFLISIFMGAGHFAFLYRGLVDAEASASAVISQLGVPIMTILSIIFLGEVVGWRRGIGIMLAFAGSLVIAIDPSSFSLSYGLVYITVAVFVASIGSILMKRMTPMSALQMQAWIGLFSFAPLFLLSGLTETDGLQIWIDGGAWVWAATAFAVLGVSVFAHGGFYILLKKYDVSLLSPLTLMMPIWGVGLSILLLGERLSLQLIVGSVIALSGVFIILVRPNRSMPEAALGAKVRGTKP